MNTHRVIEFNLGDKNQAIAFGNLVAALNQNGVPFSLRFEQVWQNIYIEISDGY